MTTRARALVEIGDRNYDLVVDKYARRPLAAVRDQVDQNREPGEGSLANTAIWSRTGRDFVLGAGQDFFDEEDSDRRRFRSSTGIDPWERRTLKLLHTTQLARSSTEDDQTLIATSKLWHVAGHTLARREDDATWTTITGLALNTILSITTDGTAIYLTDGLDLYKVDDASDTSAAVFSTTDLLTVGYANGRLLGGGAFAGTAKLYEISAAGTATELFEHPDGSGFGSWGNITAAPNGIYLTWSTSDGYSTIYYVGVNATDGSLEVPVSVGSTHRVYSMRFVAAVLVLGTDIGFQLAEIQAGNQLTIGPTVLVEEPVRCLAWDGFFVWYGRTRTAGVSGLGRLNPARFTTEQLVPPYADDLAGTAVGVVNGAASFLDKRWFTIAGVGVHEETDSYVAQGTYLSGSITYGIPERKSVAGVEVKHLTLPTAASVAVQLVEEDGTTTTVLTSIAGLGAAGPVDTISGEAVDVGIVLNRGADASLTPEVRRWTLRTIPQPYRSEELYLPLRLLDQVKVQGVDTVYNSFDDWRYLKALELSRERVACRIGAEDLIVYVDAVAIDPGDGKKWNDRKTSVDGIVTVKLVTVDVGS